MPALGRNTFPLTADGYVLPSGKTLTREDARLIGDSAGLQCSIPDDHPDWMLHPSTGERVFMSSHIKIDHPDGGTVTVERFPVYRPFIDENKPLPPMLQFFTTGLKPTSSYTINLNTWRPTRNSPIQTCIPKHIRSKYELSC